MAVNGWAIGAGVGTNYGSYRVILEVSENINAAQNYSTINWNAYLIKDSASGYSYSLDDVSRVRVYIDDRWVNDHYWHYDFRSPNNGAGATYGLNASGTTNWATYHGSDGRKSISIRVIFEGAGPLYTGDTGWQTYTLTDFNRSANTPYYTEITRTAANQFYTTYARTGSVNGPTSYVLERATNANMTVDYTTIPEGYSSCDPNTSYYFRMYAYGEEGGNKYSGVYGPYHGQPTPPQSVNVSTPIDSEDRILVSFTPPAYTGSGITSYTVTRNGSPSATFSGMTSLSFIDTDANKIPGNSYTYSVQASSSAYTSASITSGSVTSFGPPYAPSAAPSLVKIGRNVTVTSPSVSGNGGISINQYDANQGYFVQYQTATTQNGTYSSWSTPVKMTDQVNRQHTYQLLDAALWYKFRVYAANSVTKSSNGSSQIYYPHNNSGYTAKYSPSTTAIFVSAGGRRLRNPGEANENTFQPTETAKRYGVEGAAPLSQTVKWWDLTTAKRFDGTNWIDLT